jgi:hypothetical protein
VEGSAAPVELDMAEAWRLDGCVEDGSDYHVKLFRKRYHPRRAAVYVFIWGRKPLPWLTRFVDPS